MKIRKLGEQSATGQRNFNIADSLLVATSGTEEGQKTSKSKFQQNTLPNGWMGPSVEVHEREESWLLLFTRE